MDAKPSDRSTLIPLGELYKDLEACGAGVKVLLVDANSLIHPKSPPTATGIAALATTDAPVQD